MATSDSRQAKKNKPQKLLYLALLFLAIFVLSLYIGRFRISILDLAQVLGQVIRGQEVERAHIWSVFYHIRLPRLLLVSLVGAALSLSGATYQSIFHNPLVSPGILGVSAGACFGVALGLIYFSGSIFAIYFLAFIFGILSVLCSYFLAQIGRGGTVMTMVLSGIIITSLFNALISLLKFIADPYEELPGIVFWLMGSFSNASWAEVMFSVPLIIPCIVIILFLRWYLNILSMGDEEATSMGLNVGPMRILFIGVNTLMVAIAVATTGQVTWIGLVVPHIARFLFGADHRYMLPAAAILGSSFMLIIDNMARTLVPVEIPVSILSALIGTPFFAYLLITKRESGWK